MVLFCLALVLRRFRTFWIDLRICFISAAWCCTLSHSLVRCARGGLKRAGYNGMMESSLSQEGSSRTRDTYPGGKAWPCHHRVIFVFKLSTHNLRVRVHSTQRDWYFSVSNCKFVNLNSFCAKVFKGINYTGTILPVPYRIILILKKDFLKPRLGSKEAPLAFF